MSDFNPVLQFRAEAIVRNASGVYALAGGAWLVCTHDEIREHGYFKKGNIFFRDYWALYCYDDACQAALELKAAAV